MDMFNGLEDAYTDANRVATATMRPTEVYRRDDGTWSWRYATDWRYTEAWRDALDALDA